MMLVKTEIHNMLEQEHKEKKENERCSPLKCCLIKPSFQYIIFDLDTNYVLPCKLLLTDNSGSDLACHFSNPFAPLTTFLLIK